MVIFPGIVQKMSGTTSAKYLQQLAQIGDNKSQSSELATKPESFRISFTVPMQKVDSETKIKSPNIQINKTKETNGQQSTWKSPLLAKNDR